MVRDGPDAEALLKVEHLSRPEAVERIRQELTTLTDEEQCARAAAAAVREALDQNDFGGAPFQRYAEARSAMLRDITRLTAFLLRLARRPAAVERALGRFARRPALLEKLMGIAAGASRWKDIPLRDRFLLATGL